MVGDKILATKKKKKEKKAGKGKYRSTKLRTIQKIPMGNKIRSSGSAGEPENRHRLK